MSELNRAYIATKTVRHVALYSTGNWQSLCSRGPDWDYRDDFDSFIWDADPNYDDRRWLLPVCKPCLAEADVLHAAAHSPAPPVPVGSPGKGAEK